MWEWSGDIVPLIPLLFCTLLSTALHKLTGSTTRITYCVLYTVYFCSIVGKKFILRLGSWCLQDSSGCAHAAGLRIGCKHAVLVMWSACVAAAESAAVNCDDGRNGGCEQVCDRGPPASCRCTTTGFTLSTANRRTCVGAYIDERCGSCDGTVDVKTSFNVFYSRHVLYVCLCFWYLPHAVNCGRFCF